MAKVSIIGVGDVGSTLAYTLQMAGLATEIVLVDQDRDRAHGHAMDMSHGLPFTPPLLIRAGDYPDCVGSRLIILTAGAKQRPGENRLDLVRRNGEIGRQIVHSLGPHIGTSHLLIISNPVDVMTQVVLMSSGLPRNRVFGSGTVLDTARFRYELGRRCRLDPRNVHAHVVGEHGDSEVFLWSRVHIAGTPLRAFCRLCPGICSDLDQAAIERAVRESAYHIIETKGYTNYGVSQAVLRVIGALLRNERSVLTVSVRVEGEYGLRDICLSLPCLVGSDGVEQVLETELEDRELQALERSAGVIRGALGGLG